MKNIARLCRPVADGSRLLVKGSVGPHLLRPNSLVSFLLVRLSLTDATSNRDGILWALPLKYVMARSRLFLTIPPAPPVPSACKSLITSPSPRCSPNTPPGRVCEMDERIALSPAGVHEPSVSLRRQTTFLLSFLLGVHLTARHTEFHLILFEGQFPERKKTCLGARRIIRFISEAWKESAVFSVGT